jgi:hypothetical protein
MSEELPIEIALRYSGSDETQGSFRILRGGPPEYSEEGLVVLLYGPYLKEGKFGTARAWLPMREWKKIARTVMQLSPKS